MNDMDVEINILAGRKNPMVLATTEIWEEDKRCVFVSLGMKEFIEVGQFRYKWLAEYMDKGELVQLRDAVTFFLDNVEVSDEVV